MNDMLQKSTCLITIPASRLRITARCGEPLLTILAANSILLRSDCGGRGVCGKCRIELLDAEDSRHSTTACTCRVDGDLLIAIPSTSLISPHIVAKAEIRLPSKFTEQRRIFTKTHQYGIAVDLGTTTIAVYVVDRSCGQVLASLALKNPQSLYGDDVMSRIGFAGDNAERLAQLQRLTTGALLWAIDALIADNPQLPESFTTMTVVGNPTMIHLLLGISPASIGISPYVPQFCEARVSEAGPLGLARRMTAVQTLPHISGFIGGDILAAAVAVELAEQEPGTLLVDLGTNGELMLKGRDHFYATSCATGPAFEGATLSCGIQAVPGAIDRITVDGHKRPHFATITAGQGTADKPLGICGSGIISGIAAMLRQGVIENNGALAKDLPVELVDEVDGVRRYLLHDEDQRTAVAISQKDIRHVQLGKAALICGIEFLLAAAGIKKPTKILVAGAFGSHLDKDDLLALGMLPPLAAERVFMVGNAAGSGAIMVLCDSLYLKHAEEMASRTTTINLAANADFHNHFITRLSF